MESVEDLVFIELLMDLLLWQAIDGLFYDRFLLANVIVDALRASYCNGLLILMIIRWMLLVILRRFIRLLMGEGGSLLFTTFIHVCSPELI